MTNQFKYGDRELLVIDDEQVIVRVIKRVLAKEFGTIHSAYNFEDAKSAIEKLVKPQSIILSDFHLPGGVGLDLAKISNEARKKLQIGMFIMSGGAAGAEDDSIQQAEEIHIIDGFLRKPFTNDEVKNAIKQFYQKIGLEF